MSRMGTIWPRIVGSTPSGRWVAKKIEKFTVTARQATLYLGDVKKGDVKSFEYTLKPKYPIKAQTPATVAYEYYTPANRATAKPVELVVSEK